MTLEDLWIFVIVFGVLVALFHLFVIIFYVWRCQKSKSENINSHETTTSNTFMTHPNPLSLNNNSSGDHSSLVSVLRSDLGDVAIGGPNLVHVVCERPLEPSGTLDSQYLGPPPSYGSLMLESPPSYYGDAKTIEKYVLSLQLT